LENHDVFEHTAANCGTRHDFNTGATGSGNFR